MVKEKQVIEKHRRTVFCKRKTSDGQEVSLPAYDESELKRNKIEDFVALLNMGNLPLPI